MKRDKRIRSQRGMTCAPEWLAAHGQRIKQALALILKTQASRRVAYALLLLTMQDPDASVSSAHAAKYSGITRRHYWRVINRLESEGWLKASRRSAQSHQIQDGYDLSALLKRLYAMVQAFLERWAEWRHLENNHSNPAPIWTEIAAWFRDRGKPKERVYAGGFLVRRIQS